MSSDYLVPVALAIASITAWAMLLWRAWRKRPVTVREQKSPVPRTYRPDRREAYHLSMHRVLAALLGSALCAMTLTLALAVWLPLPPLEKTLLATLAIPVVWPAMVIILVTRPSRPWYFLFLLAGVGMLSLRVFAPSVGP